MENKLYKEKLNKDPNKVGFVPNYFKKIGVGIILFLIITSVVLHYSKPLTLLPYKETIKQIFRSSFIIGLLLIACARDKFEDEMTGFIRLKALALSFFWAVLYTVIYPIFNFLFNDTQILTAENVVVSMLIGYLIMFYIQKKSS